MSSEKLQTLHQKGASGIIAEYKCATQLHKIMTAKRIMCTPNHEILSNLHAEKVKQFWELSSEEISRANKQGETLADYIAESMASNPQKIGLSISPSTGDALRITTCGADTSKDSSEDISLEITTKTGQTYSTRISLKAYAGSISSQGSKGARASLCRMFLGKEKATDKEFIRAFGIDGEDFIKKLEQFKEAGRKFYESPEGIAFVKAYRIRKKDPEAKVNNPLRRKELSAYYEKMYGEKPEHGFAILYKKLFEHGFNSLKDDSSRWAAFFVGFRFVLGIESGIVTLNAVHSRDNDHRISEIFNSIEHGPSAKLSEIMKPHCEIVIRIGKGTASSSILYFSFKRKNCSLENIPMAIWKDATIQFKFDANKK